MEPAEFQRHGHDVVDWIANYLEHIRDYPVMTRMKPGELIDQLPREAPETGEPMEGVLEDFRRLVVPDLTHWNHPRFHAYFSVSASEPGILGEMLAAGLNVNGILWASCPAVTELEQVTLDWLRQWLGLSTEWFGIIHDTASSSTMHAIVTAREHVAPESRESGDASQLVLYCSEQAHSSVEKGAVTAGVGRRNIRKIGTDAQYRMRAELLAAAVEQDLAAGRRPFCVVATVGTTATASIDPVAACAALCEKHGMWLHVDGAYAGPAAVIEEMRHILDGVERADSMVVNPHKWLLTPVDLSVLYTRRPESMRHAFSLVPAYLRSQQDPRALNMMEYGVPLGRRFRALKLWFVMRYYGRQGMAAMLRSHIAMARELEQWVAADSRFEICAPVLFSLVCFRLKGDDEPNRRLLEAVNNSGVAFLSGTVLDGRYMIRFAIGNCRTTREDVALVWAKIRELAGEVR